MSDKMPSISRLTTQYQADEDRFCISGQLSGDQSLCRLWLTQRLMTRLIATVLDWLRNASHEGSGEVQAERARHVVAQHAARETLLPQSPVRTAPDDPSWCVHEIGVKRYPERMVLVFRREGCPSIALPLDVRMVRQWMHIVYGQWNTAGWPRSAWPAWFVEAVDWAQFVPSPRGHRSH